MTGFSEDDFKPGEANRRRAQGGNGNGAPRDDDERRREFEETKREFFPDDDELPPKPQSKPQPKPQLRPRVQRPRKGAPWLPEMAKVNTVLGVSQKDEPPTRDIDGGATCLLKLSVPKMHAFDQTQSNPDEGDEL